MGDIVLVAKTGLHVMPLRVHMRRAAINLTIVGPAVVPLKVRVRVCDSVVGQRSPRTAVCEMERG